MEMLPTHCPDCRRKLQWYGSARNGYGETLSRAYDPARWICYICAGKSSPYVSEDLRRLDRERKQ